MATYINSLAGAETPANPTFVSSIEYASERTGNVAKRLQELADRLCGTMPEAAGNAPRSVANGLFESAMQTASDITSKAEFCMEQLNRIEKALP